MDKALKSAAEKAMPGWKVVEQAGIADNMRKVTPDQIGIDIEALRRTYFSDDWPKALGMVNAAVPRGPLDDNSEFVIVEPKRATDGAAMRKTLIVRDRSKAVGSQG